ncbi:MAG: fasciclin domain-containing protein [Leptolyngbya sp. BL-A-14]
MQKIYRPTLLQTFSLLVGVAGLGVVSIPAIAQMTPNSGSSPSGEIQSAPAQAPVEVQPGSTIQAPTSTTPSTEPAQTPATGAPATSTSRLTLSELLQKGAKAGSFKTLAKAVQAAGLEQTLQESNGNFTVFAPTDEAFAALPAGTLEKLLKPENKALLRQVLAYHVVPSDLPSSDLKTGLVKTLGGGLAVKVSAGKVVVNDATVIQPDIKASNGVVHAINRVLISPTVKQRLISLK